MDDLDRRVDALLREVGERELLSRFRRLGARDVMLKARGEIVTAADVAAERALTEGLAEILPGSMIVGEEASAADPSLLTGLADHEHAWLVDPLDGTKHFAEDDEPFGIIVGLLRHGRTEAGWIYMPVPRRMAHARRGQGAFVDGVRVRLAAPPERMRGGLFTGFLPDDLRSTVEQARAHVDTDERHRCAAQSYVDLLRGNIQFALYYRTRPWDHAAGTLMVTEAGGVARRYDGRPYLPVDGRKSLLVAVDAAGWRTLHDVLVPSVAIEHPVE